MYDHHYKKSNLINKFEDNFFKEAVINLLIMSVICLAILTTLVNFRFHRITW